MDKPIDLSSYVIWLQETLEVDINKQFSEYYDSVALRAHKHISDSPFWKGLLANLDEYDGQYRLSHSNYPLIAYPGQEPKLLIKPFDSMLDKTFRINVIDNDSWPNPPHATKWVDPFACFETIIDIIRTSVVVKYLDGVQYLTDKVSELATNLSIHSEAELKAKQEGYYAAHLYAWQPIEIPNFQWDTRKVNFPLEIQIRTQVQDLIRKLLHEYYSKRRLSHFPEEEVWQWKYDSDQFSTSYIGHIIHYIEGMIVEIRTRQEE